jgi:hypothetical protein
VIQPAQVRQPDETVCFRCGVTVKRSALTCSNCGAAIVIGPAQHGAPRQLETVGPALSPSDGYYEDVVGPGRYILNFLLAGLIGLGLTYSLRKQGWLATYISVAIALLGIIVLIYTV